MAYPSPQPHYLPLAPRQHHFNTIAGHDIVKRMVWNMIQTGRLPQSILIRGPEGIGKRSLAFAMMKLVNGEPSDISDAVPTRTARNIASGDFLDFRMLGPSGPARLIKIERAKNDPPDVLGIRDVTDWAYVTPIEARKKVILIHDADRMNVQSANCFLKTLEEPPPHCLIILTTAFPHFLLDTIRSRCSAIQLYPVPQGALEDWLMASFGMDRSQAAMAALLGEGRPGHALRQLIKIKGKPEQENADLWDVVTAERTEKETYGVDTKLRQSVAQVVDRFYQYGFAAIFGAAYELRELGGTLEGALSLLLLWYRDLTLRALMSENSSLLINRDLTEKNLTQHTPSLPAILGRSLRAILEATRDAGRPLIDSQLALENLFLRLGEINRNA
ncbi:MAG: hypothetical protein NTX50_31775 [Candidatus Sumerlaeota bacterium]|nr:hypothetical protein [Candidatus Sumerlaeota bacterium]